MRVQDGMRSSGKHSDKILADSFRGKTTHVRKHKGNEIRPAWDQKTTRIAAFDYHLV